MELFRALKDILPLISLNKADNRRYLISDAFLKSESNDLIKRVNDGSISSEEEVIDTYFKGESNPRSSYSMLINRTISILLGHLTLKPRETKTDYKSVFQECYNRMNAVMYLKSEDRQSAAYELAIQTLKKSRKYHLSEISKILSREIMLRCKIIGDKHGADKHQELYEYYSNVEKKEVEMSAKINDVALLLGKYKKPKDEVREKLLNILDSILAIDFNDFENVPYIIVYKNLYARIIKACILSDHKEAEKVYTDIVNYKQVMKFMPTGHFFSVKYLVTPSLIIKKKYTAALRNADESAKMRLKGEFNWHLPMMHKAICAFHKKDYALARKTIKLAKTNDTHSGTFVSEWWILAEGFLYVAEPESFERFKVGKFLNELPTISKDKQGANVAIIVVAEFMMKLIQNDRDHLIERNEAIRLYTYEHLEEQTNVRAKIFFQILRRISKEEFDLEQFKLSTAGLYKKLCSYPLEILDLDTEIIPYEALYKIILHILMNQRKSVRKVKVAAKNLHRR